MKARRLHQHRERAPDDLRAVAAASLQQRTAGEPSERGGERRIISADLRLDHFSSKISRIAARPVTCLFHDNE
jgi:hypothetical protein